MSRRRVSKLLGGRRQLLERAWGTMQVRGYRPYLIMDKSLQRHGFDFLIDRGSDSEEPSLVCVMEREIELSRLKMFSKYLTKRKKELWLLHFYKEIKNDPGRFLVYRFEGAKLITEPNDWPLEKFVKSSSKKKDQEYKDQVQENRDQVKKTMDL